MKFKTFVSRKKCREQRPNHGQTHRQSRNIGDGHSSSDEDEGDYDFSVEACESGKGDQERNGTAFQYCQLVDSPPRGRKVTSNNASINELPFANPTNCRNTRAEQRPSLRNYDMTSSRKDLALFFESSSGPVDVDQYIEHFAKTPTRENTSTKHSPPSSIDPPPSRYNRVTPSPKDIGLFFESSTGPVDVDRFIDHFAKTPTRRNTRARARPLPTPPSKKGDVTSSPKDLALFFESNFGPVDVDRYIDDDADKEEETRPLCTDFFIRQVRSMKIDDHDNSVISDFYVAGDELEMSMSSTRNVGDDNDDDNGRAFASWLQNP